jgi:3D (Asp-Asp-Asp) domain-containing protein
VKTPENAVKAGTKALCILLSLCVAAEARTRWQRFTATAYAQEGETASGKQTREGRTVAADPAVLPLGTKIEVRGAGAYSGIYLVHDTGPKVTGRQIDIFIENPAEAKEFGKKAVKVRVLRKPSRTEEAKVTARK